MSPNEIVRDGAHSVSAGKPVVRLEQKSITIERKLEQVFLEREQLVLDAFAGMLLFFKAFLPFEKHRCFV